MRPTDMPYAWYEHRLARSLAGQRLPKHVGVILDGNRRWARAVGESPKTGHRAGARKIDEFLWWCDDLGVELVTLWLLSTDNLARPAAELEPLLDIIAETVESLADEGRWVLRVVGALDRLPKPVAERIDAAVARAAVPALAGAGRMSVNVAIGYGGRQEITDAVRSYLASRAAAGAELAEVAAAITADDIGAHLYTRGQPDPDLVIRTSGEQRLSGFLLWQSVHSEFYFCEVNWPAFRRVDFLRAMRDYARRHRRFGV